MSTTTTRPPMETRAVTAEEIRPLAEDYLGAEEAQLALAAARAAERAGAELELVGAWVWATFASRPEEAVLDALNASPSWKWASRKRAWALPLCDSPLNRKRNVSLDTLRYKYGSARLTTSGLRSSDEDDRRPLF